MNYEDIFAERGGSYHAAMQRYPEARAREFLLPLQLAGVRAGERVVDVPAGGGYLSHYLPGGCHWEGHEPCDTFQNEPENISQALLPLPWADNFADLAISIAGVHHIEDKRPLFAELHRVVRPAGRLMLADVHHDSPVARFLDDYVGAHNSTGHEGVYLGAETHDELTESGWQIVRAERRQYPWLFDSREALGRFCHQLFDLRGDDWRSTLTAASEILGVNETEEGVALQWELYMVLATPE